MSALPMARRWVLLLAVLLVWQLASLGLFGENMTDLDREIQEKVFNNPTSHSVIVGYSQRIEKAWEVVEEMERRHKLDFSLDKAFNTGWLAQFTNEPTSAKLRMHGNGRAAIAAESICRAALEALKDD